MWYSQRFRRHLCDMHIDDWDASFLSRFSPEEYVRNLETAHINNAMLYLQSHVGLCYFPTKTGKMHGALRGREDLLLRTLQLCHDRNIKVTGYYSINYNTYEHDRHPEWRMRAADGLSRREHGPEDDQCRYGLCCPNHEEYRAFVLAQIDEMLDYFPVDAMFFDMPFWLHTCYCDKCRARWATEVGGEMPIDPLPGSPEHDALLTCKYRWMGEWALQITSYVKAKQPDLPIEFNYANAVAGDSENGCGDLVNQASDYAGGDLYGGMLEHSFTCKFYYGATRNQPFEYMFSRCKPALRVHTLTKSEDEMKTSVAITAAHHGATLVIDAIDPVGTMDARVYERFGKMFDLQMPYEPWFRGTMVEDMGVYFGIHSKCSRPGEDWNSKSCAVAAAHALTERHIPYGVTGCWRDLSRYPVLVVPAFSSADAADRQRIEDYARDGGILYLSGARDPQLLADLLDARYAGMTDTRVNYIAPGEELADIFGWFNRDYPLPYEGTVPIVEGIDPAWVKATLTKPYTGPDTVQFASIHSNPPGIATDIPMIVIRPVGKGWVIWSAAPLESVDMDEYRDLFVDLLLHVRGDAPFSLACDGGRSVECTLFRGEDEMIVHAVSMCDGTVNPPVPGFDIRILCETAPCRVTLLPEETEVPFRYEDSRVIFRARELHIMDAYRIEF